MPRLLDENYEQKQIYRGLRFKKSQWDELVVCFKSRTGLRKAGTTQIFEHIIAEYIEGCQPKSAQTQADQAADTNEAS